MKKAKCYYSNFLKNTKILSSCNQIKDIEKELNAKKEKSTRNITDYLEKKYTIFILITNKNKIVDYLLENTFLLDDFEMIKVKLDKKLKELCIEDTNKLVIKYAILEEDKKDVIKKLKTEFVPIISFFKKEIKLINKVKVISDLIISKITFIFIAFTLILTVLSISNLNDMGLAINLLSIDTVSIITYFSTIDFFKSYSILLLIFILGTSFIIYVVTKVESGVFSYFYQNIFLVIKINLAAIISIYIFIMTWGIITNSNTMISKISTEYIKKVRLPSLRIVKMNNSIEEKTILLMGKDNEFIYYLTSRQIKNNILVKDKKFCENLKKENTHSYFKQLIKLLRIKDKNDIYYIGNSRYHIEKISNVKFIDKFPDFKEAFCDK